MKFERLNVPDWPLPDLVAFNRRVHERIDPLWRRRWVRWITWTFAGLFALVAAMWIYFASGLPSSEKLLAYQPDLPTNIRGYDGTPVKTFARERRVDLAYEEIPPLVVIYLNRLSDLLFTLARVANKRSGTGEVTW